MTRQVGTAKIANGLRRLIVWLSVGVVIGSWTDQTARSERPAQPSSPQATEAERARPNGTRPVEDRESPTAKISRLAIPTARTDVFTEEREAAARTFVRKNCPALSAMLDRLQVSKPSEYQRVIGDLFRTSELFTAMRQEDPGRCELALKNWQVESTTHLLAAELVSHPEQSEHLKSELRKNVEELADLRSAQAAYEVQRLEAKLQRAKGQRKQIESQRTEFVNQRLEAILQAVDRVDVGQKLESQPKR